MNSRSSKGFSLVELMIALVLGLVIIGGAISMFLANRQTYQTSENLARMSENMRMAFELMARDLREAGSTACGNTTRVANVLNNGPEAAEIPAWWADWGNAVRGYDGTANANRVAGTDSIQILAMDSSEMLSIVSHSPTAASFQLSAPSPTLRDGDIVMVCDPDHAAIFQVTNYNGKVTVVHNTGTGTPGNCSKGLGYPPTCDNGPGNAYAFGPNSILAKLSATDWYVGNNGRGGTSLYRMRLNLNGGVPNPAAEEMVEGVSKMQLTYLTNANGISPAGYAPATSFSSADWADVIAVRIALTVESPDPVATTPGQPLQRTFTHIVQLRNRTP